MKSYLYYFTILMLLLVACFSTPAPNPAKPQNPSSPQTGTALRQDGTILLNGSPFFLFGFYTNARATINQQMQAVQTFSKAGLNTLFFDPLGASADQYDLLFDEAAKQNVMLISRFWSVLGGAQDAEGNWFPTPDVPFVHRFKNKPALLAWALVDDVQQYNNNRGVVAEYKSNVKSADPNHITYLTGDPGDNKAISYLDSTDLMAIQSYPIPNCCAWTPAVPQGAPQLSKTYWDIANSVAKTEPAGKPVIANLQAFSWDYPGHPETVTERRWPTPQELDNMTYQALIAGAKGILYYTFENFDPIKLAPPEKMLPETHPELWERVPVLAEELKRLTPALLNGKRVSFISDDQAVYGATWSFEDKTFLAVVNTAGDQKGIRVALDVTPGTSLQPFSENRAASLTLSEGRLTGFVEARGVQLYEIENP
jgi:hypothetical protein